MIKKIIYIILCCLFLIQAEAQNTVNELIGSIKTNIKAIPNKSIGNCQKNIDWFKNILERKPVDTVSIQFLIDSSNAFIGSPGTDTCIKKYKKLSTLIPLTTRLITALQYLNDSLKNINKDSADTNTKDTAVSHTLNATDSSSQTSLTPNSFTSFATANPLLLIAVSLLFVLTLVIIILYTKTHKDLRSAIKVISDLANKPGEKQTGMEDNTTNFEKSQPPAETKENQLAESVTVINEIAADKTKANSYFICEVMMTAGPRKEDNEDIDLGEDVCGFISNENEVLVWLLDGTSNSNHYRDKNNRENFSSRLLAQCIADKLRKSFTEKVAEPLDKIIKRILQEVISEWQKEIDKLPADESLQLTEFVKDKKSVQCSTTILAAKLAINGHFTAYRSGDSKMLLFAASSPDEISLVETSLEEKNDKSDDRIFLALELKNGSVRINSNNDKLQYETITEKNIKTAILFSDGIGINTAYFLKQEFKNDPVKTRKEIVHQKQGTQDDKSICFIEIKQTGKP